jgi:hypothetical protein
VLVDLEEVDERQRAADEQQHDDGDAPGVDARVEQRGLAEEARRRGTPATLSAPSRNAPAMNRPRSSLDRNRSALFSELAMLNTTAAAMPTGPPSPIATRT